MKQSMQNYLFLSIAIDELNAVGKYVLSLITIFHIYTSNPRIMNQNIESFLQLGDASMVVFIEDINGIRVVEYIPPVFEVRPN